MDLPSGIPFIRVSSEKTQGVTCRFSFAAHLWNGAEVSSWSTIITGNEMIRGVSVSKDSLEHFRLAIELK